jgi:DNA-binding FrmR family transcriptional regulator
MSRVAGHLRGIEKIIESASAGEDRAEVVVQLRARMIGIATHAEQSAQFSEANASFSDAVEAYARAPTPANLTFLGSSFLMYRAAAVGGGEAHA